MTRWSLLASAGVLMCVLAIYSGADRLSAQASHPAEPRVTAPRGGEWSEDVKGLSGRLLLEREDVQGAVRYAAFLELRNNSTEMIAFTTAPDLTAELTDEMGKQVLKSSSSMSGPIPRPGTVELPPGVYAGFRVDVQTMGIPTQGILLSIGGNSEVKDYGTQAWSLREGTYELRVKATITPRGNAGFWYRGTIDLPPVKIKVTKKDLQAQTQPQP